jgi:negative regulator of flagellin synthesis FlgM
MIKPVGQAMSAAIEAAKLRETAQTRSSAPVAPAASGLAEEAVANPATRLAAQGAPVDLDKISRIKSAIASGNYPVDPEKIADRMVELDLPQALH